MHIIWYNLTPFILYFLQSQTPAQRAFKTTADNYFWGLTFFLSSFSHHIELVVKGSHFSNIVVRSHQKQTIHLKMHIYDAVLLANTLKYKGLFGPQSNFPVILSNYLIFFSSSVVIKLHLKTRHVSLSSHSLWKVFTKLITIIIWNHLQTSFLRLLGPVNTFNN